MQKFPKWVPEEVIAFFHALRQGHHHYDEASNRIMPSADSEAIDVLMYVMQSPEMEMQKAWKAISSRAKKEDIDPTLFAEAILDVSIAECQMNQYPRRQDIKDLHQLARKIRDLKCELKQEASKILDMGWEDWRLEWRFDLQTPSDAWMEETLEATECPPLDVLEQFAEYFEETASDMEEALAELTTYIGKPGMENPKSIYVIRMLSEEIQAIYGTPLTEVVAATSGVMLDEDIDSDRVQKLVKLHGKRKLAYWGR